MIKVLIGSKNPVKIGAVKDAFSRYFSDVNVTGMEVVSRVSNQPMNEDTFVGAENRAMALRTAENKRLNADFYVGIEGGIIKLHGLWFAFGAMCIIDKKGRKAFGMSPNFELPGHLVERLLREGKELGEVADEIAGDINVKQKGGMVGYLTKGIINRRELYVSGLILALAPFMNDGLYFGKA